MKRLMALFVLLGCLLCGSAASCSPPQQEPIICLQLINQERQAAGLAPLVFDDALLNCTDVRAQEIVAQFAHQRPDGSDCFSIFPQFGVNFRTCGENIAYGTDMDGAAAYDIWLNSPPHHDNYMNPAFDRVGISAFAPGDGIVYWVQMFTGGQRGGSTYTFEEQPQSNPAMCNQPAEYHAPQNYPAPQHGHGHGPGQSIAGRISGY